MARYVVLNLFLSYIPPYINIIFVPYNHAIQIGILLEGKMEGGGNSIEKEREYQSVIRKIPKFKYYTNRNLNILLENSSHELIQIIF